MATATNPEEAPAETAPVAAAAPAPAPAAAPAPAPKRLNGFAIAGISIGSVILTLALIGGGVAIGANLPNGGGRPGIGQQQDERFGDGHGNAPGQLNGPGRPGDGPRHDGPPAGGPNGGPNGGPGSETDTETETDGDSTDDETDETTE